MLEKLMANPYAWLALAILAIASFIYAIVCQQMNKEKKEFSFRHQALPLIVKKKSKYEKLTIYYDEQEIEDLTVSRFIIWNSGNKTLNGQDMVASKELTITALGDHIILDTELVAQTEETNKFFIKEIDDHTIKVFFDYVDKKDGIVLQVMHTGTKEDLEINCKIKGGKPIKNAVKKSRSVEAFLRRTLDLRVMSVVILTLMIFMLLLAIISSLAIINPSLQIVFQDPTSTRLTAKQNAVCLSIVSWLYTFVMAFTVIPIIKRIFNLGIPKSLRKYIGSK